MRFWVTVEAISKSTHWEKAHKILYTLYDKSFTVDRLLVADRGKETTKEVFDEIENMMPMSCM